MADTTRMVFGRGTRAARCDRCGRILAPYSTCRLCSIPASAGLRAAREDNSLETLIAEALPETVEAEPTSPAHAPPPVAVAEIVWSVNTEPVPLPPVVPPAPEQAATAAVAVAVDAREPVELTSMGFYDPEDFAIPRDPDVFVGSGGHRRRRLF